MLVWLIYCSPSWICWRKRWWLAWLGWPPVASRLFSKDYLLLLLNVNYRSRYNWDEDASCESSYLPCIATLKLINLIEFQ